MITDEQVRKLMTLKQREKNLSIAAAKSGMSENTARKYIQSNQLTKQTIQDLSLMHHIQCNQSSKVLTNQPTNQTLNHMCMHII